MCACVLVCAGYTSRDAMPSQHWETTNAGIPLVDVDRRGERLDSVNTSAGNSSSSRAIAETRQRIGRGTRERVQAAGIFDEIRQPLADPTALSGCLDFHFYLDDCNSSSRSASSIN